MQIGKRKFGVGGAVHGNALKLDLGDGCTTIKFKTKIIELYVYNRCILFHVNYTSEKLLKRCI